MLDDVRLIVVGFGLMGGSLARAVRPKMRGVIAVDADAATRNAAIESGIADAAFATIEEVNVSADDLVILATPVSAIIDTLNRLTVLATEGCMVMDIGSTKWDICRTMNGLPGWFQAIGGHPMCGKETSGFAVSSADLYDNQTFILTPTVRTTPYLKEVALALIAALNANPIIIPPKEHDQTVALISHLPYLLSATLMQQASNIANGTDTVWHVSASGFRSMSRLSGSSPAMMRDILLTNRPAVISQLLRYQRELAAVVEMVNDGDRDALVAWLEEKQAQHTHYQQIKNNGTA